MRGEEEEFLNHRFHRLHRLGNGFGVSAGDTMGGKRLVSCHVPREGILTEVADTTPNLHSRQRQTIFLVCVICEICGLKILLLLLSISPCNRLLEKLASPFAKMFQAFLLIGI
jgi:hypothetical protein